MSTITTLFKNPVDTNDRVAIIAMILSLIISLLIMPSLMITLLGAKAMVPYSALILSGVSTYMMVIKGIFTRNPIVMDVPIGMGMTSLIFGPIVLYLGHAYGI